MSGVWIAALAVAVTAAGVAKAAMASMIQEETSTRLNRIPFALIQIAATRVPDELRAELAAEWTAELRFVLRGTEGMPLTRLWRGIRFSAGLLLSAGLVADGLRGASRRSVQWRPRAMPKTEPPPRSGSSPMLSLRQRQILQAIRDSSQRTGHPPSLREIAKATGLASPSTVSYHLLTLEKLGYLRRVTALPSTVQIRLPSDPPFPKKQDPADG